MEVFTFFIVAILAFCVWYHKKYYANYLLALKIPGPKPLPFWLFLGNAFSVLGKTPVEMLVWANDLTVTHGKVARFLLGPKVQIIITDPNDVEVILGSQKLIDKSDEYDFIHNWLGTGLLTSTGQKWFTRRKVITPTFHFKILEQFVDIFDEHSKIFVSKLAKFKVQVDIFPLVALAALDVICGEIEIAKQIISKQKKLKQILSNFKESAMGVHINAQNNSESAYVKAVKE
jgi:cytochrome P450 family 4